MSGSAVAASAPRILGLDALRGIAVILMIQQHLGVWFWVGAPPGQTKFDFPGLLAFNALGGGAAPMFIILAGIGCSLLGVRRSSGVPRTLVIRGIVLMGFGYLLSILTPSWFSWRTWFVLHLMGFGMVAASVLYRRSVRTLMVIAAAIIVAAPLLQSALDTPNYFNNARMVGHANSIIGGPILPGGHLRLAAVEGQFPIFPWLGLFLVGLAAGQWIVQERFAVLLKVGLAGVALGLLMMALYFGGADFAQQARRVFGMNIPFFPSTVAFVLAIGGLCLAVIGGVLMWERRHSLKEGGPLVSLGRASLTLLLLHVWFFREVRPFGLWRVLEPAEVFLAVVLVLVICAVLAQLWRRIDYRYGAEWLLRTAAKRRS